MIDFSAADIAPRRGEFTDPRAEAAFTQSQLSKTHAQLRSTLLFCSCFYVAFSISDVGVLGYSLETLYLLLVRAAVALTAAGTVALMVRAPESVAMTRFAASATEIVGMAAFLQVVLHRPTEIPWHAMSMALMLIVVYIYIPNRLMYSVGIALAATCAFVVLVLAQGRLAPSEILTMTMLLLLANAFGFVAATRYHVLWREEYRSQLILKDLSIRDSLTGCYNRHYLQQPSLDAEVTRAKRMKQTLSVLMCDLDHFKAINDTFGHSSGDQVLREFARLLLTNTRANVDSVVRYGGEEFLVVLPGIDAEGGASFAERLRAMFAASTMLIELHPAFRATASFGVVSVDFAASDASLSLHDMVAQADALLYEAKHGGRNQVKSRQLR